MSMLLSQKKEEVNNVLAASCNKKKPITHKTIIAGKVSRAMDENS